jgi:hypothetical protein
MNAWIKDNPEFVFLQLLSLPFDIIYTIWYLPIFSLMSTLFIFEYAPIMLFLILSFGYVGVICIIHLFFFCITPNKENIISTVPNKTVTEK